MSTATIARNLVKWRQEQEFKQAREAASKPGARALGSRSDLEAQARALKLVTERPVPKFKKLVEYEAANGMQGWMTVPG